MAYEQNFLLVTFSTFRINKFNEINNIFAMVKNTNYRIWNELHA